jgi:hypothetical protein
MSVALFFSNPYSYPDDFFNKYVFVDRLKIQVYFDLDNFLSSNLPKIAVITELSNIDKVLGCDQIVVLFQDNLSPAMIQQIKKYDRQNICFCFNGNINFELAHATKIQNLYWVYSTTGLFQYSLSDLLKTKLSPWSPKSRYFDVLYGIEKEHRRFVKDYLSQYSDTNYFIESPFIVTESNNMQHNFAKSITQSVDNIFWEDEIALTGNNHGQYFGQEVWIGKIVPFKVYNASAYSLICETSFDNSYSFFSEKIAKPIVAGRLFVVISGQYYLRNLRQIGFKTFDGIIDESYDNEANNQTRWTMALDQVIKLCNMDQEFVLKKVAPIALHNYNVALKLGSDNLDNYLGNLFIKYNCYKTNEH